MPLQASGRPFGLIAIQGIPVPRSQAISQDFSDWTSTYYVEQSSASVILKLLVTGVEEIPCSRDYFLRKQRQAVRGIDVHLSKGEASLSDRQLSL